MASFGGNAVLRRTAACGPTSNESTTWDWPHSKVGTCSASNWRSISRVQRPTPPLPPNKSKMAIFNGFARFQKSNPQLSKASRMALVALLIAKFFCAKAWTFSDADFHDSGFPASSWTTPTSFFESWENQTPLLIQQPSFPPHDGKDGQPKSLLLYLRFAA